MRILTLAATKGGPGKTTLSCALAVEAVRRGEKVALLDLDPQGTLFDWWTRRGKPGNPFLLDEFSTIVHATKELEKDGHTLLIIDTPPAILETVQPAIRAADLVLIPARPNIFDLEAVVDVVELATDEGTPVAFVLNQVPSRAARRLDQAKEILKGGGPLLKQAIVDRVAWGTAPSYGKTGGEMNGDANIEVRAVWREVDKLLPARKARP